MMTKDLIYEDNIIIWNVYSFKKSWQYLKQNEYKDFEKLSNSPLHRDFNTYPLSHNYMLTIQKDTEDI